MHLYSSEIAVIHICEFFRHEHATRKSAGIAYAHQVLPLRVGHGIQPSIWRPGQAKRFGFLAYVLCSQAHSREQGNLLNGWCQSLRAPALLKLATRFSREQELHDTPRSIRTTQAGLCLEPDPPTTFLEGSSLLACARCLYFDVWICQRAQF